MSRVIRRPSLLVAVATLMSLSFVSIGAPVAAADSHEEGSAAVVESWLVLGPVIDPLPVFYDEDRGTFGVKDQLDAAPFDLHGLTPASGGEVAWFSGVDLEWEETGTTDGAIELPTPDGVGEARPLVAWLATWVETDRFRTAKLTVTGAGARKVWIDGSPVATGGLSGKGDVTADLKLVPGKHLVLIEARHVPAAESDDADGSDDAGSDGGSPGWSVGATFATTKPKDAPAPTFSLDPSRPMTIRDILDPAAVGSYAVSPDGSAVALALARIVPGTDDRETWLELRSTADGSLINTWRGDFDMGQVDWAPAGKRLSYVTRSGSGSNRTATLWIADLENGAVTALLERVSRFSGYTWSPGGSTIVYSTTNEAPKSDGHIKRVESLRDRWAGFRTKSQLNLVNVESGFRRRLTAGAESNGQATISPDGGRLLFSRSLEDVGARPYSRTEVWELDLTTFEASQVLDSRWANSVAYSPDGRTMLVQGGPEAFGDLGVNLPDGGVANNYDGQLYLYSAETGEPQALTRDFNPSIRFAEWSGVDEDVYFIAEDGEYVRFFRLDPLTGDIAMIETAAEATGSFSLARSAPIAVVAGTSTWRWQELEVIDLTTGERRPLLSPGDEHFANVRAGGLEKFDFVSSAGTTIEGRVYLPPGFDETRKYPAIVYYYGGTSPTSRDFGGRYPKELWAANGYVVYDLQPSGATGFGQQFSAAHVNDWGIVAAEEIIEGTAKFLDAHTYVDPARVGCIGASYGGFMTMLLTTKSDQFAGCVAHAGISSIASYWGEGYWGFGYSATATADAFPWNRRDIYVEQSALFRADKTRVPLLLTHGAVDTNVPIGESDQLFIALTLLGKEVEYLQVGDTNHTVLEHARRIEWNDSILAWFDRFLKGQPEWWETLYPDPEKK